MSHYRDRRDPVSEMYQDHRQTSHSNNEASHPDEGSSDEETYDPPWAPAVGAKGDLFYVEPHKNDSPRLQSGDGESSNYSDANHFNGNSHQPQETKKGVKKKTKNKGKPLIVNNKNGNFDPGVHSASLNGTHYNGHTILTVGEEREIHLHVDPHRHHPVYARKGSSLCESLLGIVPGHFHAKLTEVNGTLQDNKIVVQGLVPGGEAMRSGEVKIGEWLMLINDFEITFDNMESLLSAITSPKTVKLTFKKLVVQAQPPPAPPVKPPPVNEELVKLISGERLIIRDPTLDNVPHTVLYLTLTTNSETMGAKDDIVYQFPKKDEKLIDVRGMFTTMAHLMKDVTGTTAKNSTIILGGTLVHVGYSVENQEVLVLAVPANRVSLEVLNHVMEDVMRVLKVTHGTLNSAFGHKENHGKLDHFFTLVLQRTLFFEEFCKLGARQSELSEPFFDILPAVRSLSLPEETKLAISSSLNDLEAAEFADMSDDYYDMRRTYVIAGSCLFYKGYLIANHLPAEDLRDLSLYLQYYCLLTLCNEEQLGQMVVWKEIYPWRRCHVISDPVVPGYQEPDARWFLLVVGIKSSMLGLLLEAGGCAQWPDGHPTPDPFYVDQAKATLLQLEAEDVPAQCEIRLQAPPIPSLACSDWFLPQPKGATKDNQSNSSLGAYPSIAKKTSESLLKRLNSNNSLEGKRPPGKGVVYDVESDEDSRSTGTSEGSTPMVDRRMARQASQISVISDGSEGSVGSSGLFKGGKKKRTMLSAYDLSGLRKGISDLTGEEGCFVKMTSGCDNTLFHYVEMDTLEGVLICPSQQEMKQVVTPIHSEVLINFHQTCLAIRRVLLHSKKCQEEKVKDQRSKFGKLSTLGHVCEHGVMLQCTGQGSKDPKKLPSSMNYWVVGRLFNEPFPREVYVCFQESAQQNLVELAFKLSFGMAL